MGIDHTLYVGMLMKPTNRAAYMFVIAKLPLHRGKALETLAKEYQNSEFLVEIPEGDENDPTMTDPYGNPPSLVPLQEAVKAIEATMEEGGCYLPYDAQTKAALAYINVLITNHVDATDPTIPQSGYVGLLVQH